MSAAVAERVNPKERLERATSDYLAVSRGKHLYTPTDYDRAEAAAWDELMAARQGHIEETDGPAGDS